MPNINALIEVALPAALKKNKVTVEELASHFQVSADTVNKWASGEVLPGPEVEAAVLAYLRSK